MHQETKSLLLRKALMRVSRRRTGEEPFQAHALWRADSKGIRDAPQRSSIVDEQTPQPQLTCRASEWSAGHSSASRRHGGKRILQKEAQQPWLCQPYVVAERMALQGWAGKRDRAVTCPSFKSQWPKFKVVLKGLMHIQTQQDSQFEF